MRKLYVYISLVLLAGLFSCTEENQPTPTPGSVSFKLISATFKGAAIDPVPDYALTLHFDADGTPTTYETSGSAIAVPTPQPSGSWSLQNDKVVFAAGDESRAVDVNLDEITTLSSSYELQWSFGKTEIDWEYVGEYTYRMERVD